MEFRKQQILCGFLVVVLSAFCVSCSPLGSSSELYEGAEQDGGELSSPASPYDKLSSELTARSNSDDDDGDNESASNNNEVDGGTVEADIESADSSDFSPRTRSASSAANDEDSDATGSNDSADSIDGQDSNIENARVELSPSDKMTAAGHHYHGHGPHGWLKMGASTGKKGAFKWHDKHPVGGKGRR